MYLVSRVAGADVELEEFLPPLEDEQPEKRVDTGQHALNIFLKANARAKANRG